MIVKLREFDLPADCVFLWIVHFLTDRSQCTKLSPVLSTCLAINRSIVQGSGIGPSLFSLYIHDLKVTGKSNSLIKFADDCSLLVPANSTLMYLLKMSYLILSPGVLLIN